MTAKQKAKEERKMGGEKRMTQHEKQKERDTTHVIKPQRQQTKIQKLTKPNQTKIIDLRTSTERTTTAGYVMLQLYKVRFVRRPIFASRVRSVLLGGVQDDWHSTSS